MKNQSLRIPNEVKHKRQLSFNTKKKNRLKKCGTSEMFKRLVARNVSDCELYSEFSKQHLSRNRINNHSDFSLSCPLPVPTQVTGNSGEFNKFIPITKHPSDDSTRTGNIAESLKILLSTFKRPITDIERDNSNNSASSY